MLNLKEKIKKWKRNWYELSVDELKKKQKNSKYLELIFDLSALLILVYGASEIMMLSSGNLITLLKIFGIMFIIQLVLLIMIVLHNVAIDYHRDVSDLNILNI